MVKKILKKEKPELKYPMSDGLLKQSLFHYQLKKEHLHWMRPDEFLELVPKDQKMLKIDYNRERIRELKERLEKGIDTTPLVLWMPYRKEPYKIGESLPVPEGHEGRHRAMAARSLGIDLIPVLVKMNEPKLGER